MHLRTILGGILLGLASLSGPSAAERDDAPRAARSVHLWWPAPDGELFYNEMTVEKETPTEGQPE